MIRPIALSIFLAGCASAETVTQQSAMSPAPDCRLVIVGGALDKDNGEVWSAFLDAARELGDIAIVPAASGYPSGSGQAAKGAMVHNGWPEDRIRVLPLAVKDDPDTDDIDESGWEGNAETPAVVEALESAAGIWFTGGDQARIAELFGTANARRPALVASQKACRNGAVIGGTSAGAAIMSKTMIVGGDSLPTLLGESDPDEGALTTEDGLGFFPRGIIDQHFGERAREGRLLSALARLESEDDRIGFGVDEDTGLVVDPDGVITVTGSGQVTVIDARRTALSRNSDHLSADAVTLHLFSRGDRFDLPTARLIPADWRKSTLGDEYFDAPSVAGTGIAVPQPKYSELLGDGLLDNSAATQLIRFTFTPSGEGFAFTFTQVPESQGYWGRDENGRAAYTLANIRLDIRPMTARMETSE
ncbi:MAG: cyanophycinase [Pseudomonadota bacterium]